jgi:hypothetical protein
MANGLTMRILTAWSTVNRLPGRRPHIFPLLPDFSSIRHRTTETICGPARSPACHSPFSHEWCFLFTGYNRTTLIRCNRRTTGESTHRRNVFRKQRQHRWRFPRALCLVFQVNNLRHNHFSFCNRLRNQQGWL